ncbi:MAG: UDP-N-acetylglucosamine 2-epimerase (hydrolyzing) [Alphaproteobacteria bacterium]|nr:UDP-N-acetylglucosamine 2-epimerase (hydrolyzing) [Alphaproteobacteria bacterium]
MTRARRRVCIVVGSRANYGRIKSVMAAVRDHADLELVLIVGASALLFRYGQAVDVIEADGFEVHARVYSIVEGENPSTMAKSTGLGIIELTTQFETLDPDVVLTVADRFETLATAVAASYMNIPLAHTQGGEVTGSIDESVRHAITKLAHIHFTATELSRERVLRMGEDPETVFVTGCPSLDPLRDLARGLPSDFFAAHGGSGAAIDATRPFLLVLQHPVTTEYRGAFAQIEETLAAVKAIGMPTVWLWPNVDAGSDSISKGLRLFVTQNPGFPLRLFRNFAVEDYARVMASAACIVGNSSSALREGAFLGVPAVNIGTRQHRRERGANVLDVGYDHAAIETAIRRQVSHGAYPSDPLYGDGHSGPRIADLLARAAFNVQKSLAY